MVTPLAFAQQNAQYNQYIFNQLVLNPAYAGTKGILNINAIYSTQWTGLEGSPNTQSFSAETPLFRNMGGGIHIINDAIGAQTQTSFYGSYSYKLKITPKLKLSFGLAMGVSNYTLDGQKLISGDIYDPAIPENYVNRAIFDSKAGLFLYSRKFYAGLSVSELTSNIKKSAELIVSGQAKHFYLTSGYVFEISPVVKFKPNFLLKEDFKALSNIDLNAFFLFYDKYWIGGTFRIGANVFTSKELDNSLRTRDAVVLMADVNINRNLRIGYSYTITVSSLSSYPGHEIALGYYISKKTESKMVTPRYF